MNQGYASFRSSFNNHKNIRTLTQFRRKSQYIKRQYAIKAKPIEVYIKNTSVVFLSLYTPEQQLHIVRLKKIERKQRKYKLHT